MCKGKSMRHGRDADAGRGLRAHLAAWVLLTVVCAGSAAPAQTEAPTAPAAPSFGGGAQGAATTPGVDEALKERTEIDRRLELTSEEKAAFLERLIGCWGGGEEAPAARAYRATVVLNADGELAEAPSGASAAAASSAARAALGPEDEAWARSAHAALTKCAPYPVAAKEDRDMRSVIVIFDPKEDAPRLE